MNKTIFSIFLTVLLIFVFLTVFAVSGFLGESYQLAIYSYFAPRYAKVERNVFENTPSYQIGNVQELHNMQMQYYSTKDPNGKAAIAALILHRADDIPDENTLPSDLKEFIFGLRQQQTQQIN